MGSRWSIHTNSVVENKPVEHCKINEHYNTITLGVDTPHFPSLVVRNARHVPTIQCQCFAKLSSGNRFVLHLLRFPISHIESVVIWDAGELVEYDIKAALEG